MADKRKCVILAGGASRRFGEQDKPFALLGGRPLISHVMDCLGRDKPELAINAPRKPEYEAFGLPLLPDIVEGRPGPLAGVLTAMRWAQAQGARYVFTVPADTPFLPEDLLDELDRTDGRIVMAASKGRVHNLCARWSCALADKLEHALLEEGMRAVWAFSRQHAFEQVNFIGREDIDPFFNVNSPHDLEKAEGFLPRLPG